MRKFLAIGFVLIAFCITAQVKVDLIIEPSTAEIGETFEVTVTSTEIGTIDFSKIPDEFIQDYAIKQGSTHQSGPNGATVLHYYTISGVIKTPGNYTFGPVTLTEGNISHVSNTVTINISPKVKMIAGSVSKQQFRDAAFGIIEANKTTLYEGEPLLIRAKVYARYKPTHVQNYSPYTLRGAIVKHPMGGGSGLNALIERFRGEEFYALDYDKNVVFPSGVGRLTIEPYKLNLHQGYQNFHVLSSKLNITVLSLPANPPKDFIGAVGTFDVARVVKEKKFSQGDVIKMKVVVRGIGNLHNITVPQLKLPKGFTIYGDPIIDEDYTVGIRGAEGEITYEFNIEVTASGMTYLPATSITYFDPNLERYVTVETTSDSLDIKESKIFKNALANDNKNGRASELVVHEFNPRTDSGQHARGTVFGTPVFWGGVSIPLASAFLFLLFAKRKEGEDERNAAKIARNKHANEIQENLAATAQAVSLEDRSIFYASLEKTVRSVFAVMSTEDKVLSKQEMIDFAEKVNPEMKQNCIELFESSEIAKFSLGLNTDLRAEHLKLLEGVVRQMKQRK